MGVFHGVLSFALSQNWSNRRCFIQRLPRRKVVLFFSVFSRCDFYGSPDCGMSNFEDSDCPCVLSCCKFQLSTQHVCHFMYILRIENETFVCYVECKQIRISFCDVYENFCCVDCCRLRNWLTQCISWKTVFCCFDILVASVWRELRWQIWFQVFRSQTLFWALNQFWTITGVA